MANPLLCFLLFGVVATAHSQGSRVDSLMRRYETLWQASDSLRIEAILVRMEAAKQRVEDDAIMKSLESRALAERTKLRYASAKPGRTVADSVTQLNLSVQPDTGIASFYGNGFHGKKTSSGEVYNMNDLTCAHRWLPFGTLLVVTNVANGKRATVRVNDRGPWKHGRMIDVSKAAAAELDMIRSGTTRVIIEIAKTGKTEDSDSTRMEP